MPGVDGDAVAPMTASVASVALSRSDSNQRSRTTRAGAVRISAASPAVAPRRRQRQPIRNSAHRSRGPGRSRSGGRISSSGSTASATRLNSASYFG